VPLVKVGLTSSNRPSSSGESSANPIFWIIVGADERPRYRRSGTGSNESEWRATTLTEAPGASATLFLAFRREIPQCWLIAESAGAANEARRDREMRAARGADRGAAEAGVVLLTSGRDGGGETDHRDF
jgi:hypothetical protein